MLGEESLACACSEKNTGCKFLERHCTEDVQEAGHCVVNRGWIPACARMTGERRNSCLLPSFLISTVIPAKAGIHPLPTSAIPAFYRHSCEGRNPSPAPTSAEVKKPHLFLSNKVRLLPVTGLGFRLYFLAGSSGFLALPSMNGLHGLAFTGPGVFHTTLN